MLSQDAGGQGKGLHDFTSSRGLGWELAGLGEGLVVCRRSLENMARITVEGHC